MSIRGNYRIVDPLTSGVIDDGKRLNRCFVTVKEGWIVIGPKEYGVTRLRLFAKTDTEIDLGGEKRRYRDQIDVILNEKGQFLVVNTYHGE